MAETDENLELERLAARRSDQRRRALSLYMEQWASERAGDLQGLLLLNDQEKTREEAVATVAAIVSWLLAHAQEHELLARAGEDGRYAREMSRAEELRESAHLFIAELQKRGDLRAEERAARAVR